MSSKREKDFRKFLNFLNSIKHLEGQKCGSRDYDEGHESQELPPLFWSYEFYSCVRKSKINEN